MNLDKNCHKKLLIVPIIFCACFLPSCEEWLLAEAVRQEQVISDAGPGWSKPDFSERDNCKLVLLRLPRNLEKPVMSLYVAE
jgi:hypothetical protein